MFQPCPFCNLPPERIIEETPLGLIIQDKFPVSPGHTLIIPRRHVGSFFETTLKERADLLMLVDQAKMQLDAQLYPDGFNIGINDGPAAGLTAEVRHIDPIFFKEFA